MQHRFILQPYKTPKSRYTCPQCGRHKKFTRYMDTETNTHLADHVGKCDREDSCGYHFTPKQYFASNPGTKPQFNNPVYTRPSVIKPDTIPAALFRQTLKHYQHNNFVQYLFSLFGQEKAYRLVADYYIGTAKHWPNATIFWQVDGRQQVRTGKIMLYDAQTGKRVKQPFAHISWVHSLLSREPEVLSRKSEADSQKSDLLTPDLGLSTSNSRLPPPNFHLQQCLFGEHLLNYGQQKLVAIVESEKTAVIAAGFMPQYCWLAAGSLNGLSYQKCKVLQGRQVMLFPDANATQKWEQQMKQLRAQLPGTNIALSRPTDLPIPAEYITAGSDLADWLVGVRPFAG